MQLHERNNRDSTHHLFSKIGWSHEQNTIVDRFLPKGTVLSII